MAEEYVSFVITDKGKDIVARIIAGLNVTFSKIAIGDGFDYKTDKFSTKTELVNKVLSLNITDMEINSSKVVELIAEFAKSDIENSFWYREIGVYIIDPDDETKEILFAYGNRNDTAEYITPHIQNYAILKKIKCLVFVGESANVRIYINNNEVLNTFEFTESEWEYNDELAVYELSKGQVGFGVNVFKKTETGMKTVDFVDIVVNSEEVISVQSLEPFEGYLIFA